MELLDRESWEREILQAVRAEMYRLGRSLSVQDYEDEYQELCYRLLARLPIISSLYDPDKGGRRAWLRAIARRSLINQLKPKVDRVRYLPPEELDRLGDVADHERELERHALRRVIQSALEDLSSRISTRNLEILERRMLGQERVREIARSLGLEPRAVSRSLRRSKAKLKGLLESIAGPVLPVRIGLIPQKTRGGGAIFDPGLYINMRKLAA